MECHYVESFKDNLDKKEIVRQDEMVLRIGKTCSEFYSLWRRERDNMVDSLTAKGVSMNDLMAAREKCAYPVSVQYYAIYKNYPRKGLITHTDNLAMQNYSCTAEMKTPVWEIEREKREVAGYNCQKAATVFYGRKWIVWFTMDIPVPEGPWKLHGLPGLILQAEDEEGDYAFRCIEVKKASGLIKMPRKHYITCDEEKFTRMVVEFNSDLDAYMQKQGKSIPVAAGQSKEDVANFFKKRYNYIER